MGLFSKILGGGEFSALIKAAKRGDAEAQSEVGSRYRFGEGIQQDDYEAAKWYSKAVAQDHMFAQCYLGLMYALGQGVAKGRSKAIALLLRSAAQGVPAAAQALQELQSMRD